MSNYIIYTRKMKKGKLVDMYVFSTLYHDLKGVMVFLEDCRDGFKESNVEVKIQNNITREVIDSCGGTKVAAIASWPKIQVEEWFYIKKVD